MADEVFESLVSQLSVEERRAMLERMRQANSLSSRPIYSEALDEAESASLDELYKKKGFWEHFVCALSAFFTKRKPLQVFEERLVHSLQLRFESFHPEMVNFKRGMLLSRFHSSLENMKAASRFFYSALEASIDRDKPAFLAFLGSLEMELLHAKLISECDVYKLGEENPFWEDSQILKHCQSAMESVFSSMLEEERIRMYRQIRILHCLKRLSAFSFDRLLASFKMQADGKCECPLSAVTENLRELAEILYSFSEPPPLELLETVFLFPNRDMIKDGNAELEKTLGESLSKTETALDVIRKFMAEVSLLDLLRASLRDYHYHVRQISGGEDWFPIYKGFWKNKIDGSFFSFVKDRKRLRIVKDVSEFIGKGQLTSLAYVSNEGKNNGICVRHELLLSFILSAFEGIFIDEINRPLKILLLDGQFYRNDNRIEFTDAYSLLAKTSDLIHSYDKRLAPDGDIGRVHAEAQREFSTVGIKQHKLLAAQQTALYEADKLLQDLVHAIKVCMNVLRGILHPQQGSRYDSITNLSSIEGRLNAQFVQSLEKAKDRLERILTIILEIADIESIKLEL